MLSLIMLWMHCKCFWNKSIWAVCITQDWGSLVIFTKKRHFKAIISSCRIEDCSNYLTILNVIHRTKSSFASNAQLQQRRPAPQLCLTKRFHLIYTTEPSTRLSHQDDNLHDNIRTFQLPTAIPSPFRGWS